MNSRFSIWLMAIRPKTLPLVIGAISLASAIAYRDGIFNLPLALLMLTTALLLQIISNLANDYGDTLSGADNETRKGPLRVMQAGFVSANQMKQALYFTVGLAVVTGATLLYIALAEQLALLLAFIGLGVLAIIAALTYTLPAGKNRLPYGYHGFGDIAVFVFFGLVAVLGSYALFAFKAGADFYLLLILPAISCGLLSTAVLNINNIRDLDTDKAAGKHTLAVKLGERNSRLYHWCLLAAAELATCVYIVIAQLPLAAWLHLVTLPVLITSARALKHRTDAKLMNKQLQKTALMSFCYCLLLAIGHLL